MNLYLVEQNINNRYDSFDSFICAAESEQDAREIYPSHQKPFIKDGEWYWKDYKGNDFMLDDKGIWIKFSQITQLKVTKIGQADPSIPKGIILGSFNAG